MILLAALLAVAGALLFVPQTTAQNRSVRWLSWDVDIQINQDGTFHVTEEHQVQFIGEDFTFGYRNIPHDQVDQITNISVRDPWSAYSQQYSETENTFYTSYDNNELVITWYYPSASNETRTFFIDYTVVGGLLISDQGDGLHWKAIPPDHDWVIDNATVVVHLPPGATVDERITPLIYGISSGSYVIEEDGSAITFHSNGAIPANQMMEVGVQFTHGSVNASPPSWQADYERRQTLGPLLTLGSLAVTALLAIGGGVGLYMLWLLAGRDPDVGEVPEYVTGPPSDLEPGLVGTLVDERADLQDIMATLIDLARRGILEMEEAGQTGFLGLGGDEFIFRRKPEVDLGTLRSYERELIKGVFGHKDEVELSDLRERFYTVIPRLQRKLYQEAVEEGLFPVSPQAARRRYLVLGIAGLLIFGGVGFCAAGAAFTDITGTVVCPFVVLAVLSVGVMALSNGMPVKTRKGAEEAAKWRAFKHYLENIQRFGKLEENTDLFEPALPYAIAFGIERAWIKQFSRIETVPVPGWYVPAWGRYPHVSPIPGARGAERQAGPRDMRGQAARPGPSLDRMSQGMLGGLSSMSSGLFSMLNTTANVFTSVPRSSSGGGGFSGGGGGGGGGAGFGK